MGIIARALGLLALGTGLVAGMLYLEHAPGVDESADVATSHIDEEVLAVDPSMGVEKASAAKAKADSGNEARAQGTTLKTGQVVLDSEDLLALAGDDFADGELPLGDGKYSTSAPAQGVIYLCSTRSGGRGAMENGPWIHGSTWNRDEKLTVSGEVKWPDAFFSMVTNAAYRILSGNALPITHTTGTFPIGKSEAGYAYDRNPNTIEPNSISTSLPLSPSYSETPYCMPGGQVGVMLSGVPLLNGLDAAYRDAPAHEIQDSCGGHPQEDGEYHYHNLSECFEDTSVETVLGYANDGFPITGPVVSEGNYLTTADLDVCHGITSEIVIDGERTVSYHYVMTPDYPYSVSCFRGEPITRGGMREHALESEGAVPVVSQNQGGGAPPEAVAACSGKAEGSACAFRVSTNQISGVCRVPPGRTETVCVPGN